MFLSLVVTSIKKNYVALRSTHLLVDIQDIVFNKIYSVSEFYLRPIIPYTSLGLLNEVKETTLNRQ